MIIDRVKAAVDRDPAARGFFGVVEIVLTYAGFHALLFHDIAHVLWRLRIPLIPRIISQISRFLTGVEIHPGAKIGKGVFIDHGMGVVIGETAEVGDGTTMFQGVTLGGTGKERGKRHPTIGKNVVIGVGAAVLGNIKVGDNSYIGAGAVVLKEVPPDSTAVGVPARIVKMEGRKIIGATLDHTSLPDPVLERLQALQDELARAEQMMEVEAALPHVLLAISAPDMTAAREIIEKNLAARHCAYSVREDDGTLQIASTLCDKDYQAVRAELQKVSMLTITAEGREPNLRDGVERPPLKQNEICDGGRVMKWIISLTEQAGR